MYIVTHAKERFMRAILGRVLWAIDVRAVYQTYVKIVLSNHKRMAGHSSAQNVRRRRRPEGDDMGTYGISKDELLEPLENLLTDMEGEVSAETMAEAWNELARKYKWRDSLKSQRCPEECPAYYFEEDCKKIVNCKNQSVREGGPERQRRRQNMTEEKVTLKDVDIRCKGIREKAKEPVPDCSFKGCTNPIDWTEGMGWDTSCPYHRLLHDHFLYNEGGDRIHPNHNPETTREEYREEFRKWAEKTGKKECDRIVVEMANWAGNWMC